MNTRKGLAAAAVFCIAHLLLWGGGFALAFDTPKLDGAEQLAWSYALELGYWKHPPLPTWVLHGLGAIFQPCTAITYVAAQACVALALFIMYVLGCEFMAWQRSLAALALTSLIALYNVRAEAFNHDLALLPLIAAVALLFFYAMRTRRIALWCATGVMAGLAMLTKYIVVLFFAALFLAFLLERRAHVARNFAGMVAAAACALLVFAPHAIWLVQNDFPPLRYAHASAQALAVNRFAGAAAFLAAVVVAMLPTVVPAAVALRGASAEPSRVGAEDRRFIWIVGTVPLLLTLGYGFAVGTTMPGRWAVQGLLFSGWVAMTAWPRTVDIARLRKLLVVTAAVHLLLCIGDTVAGPRLALARHQPGRSNFPAAAMAQAAQTSWREHTPAPLRLVIATHWLGGNLIAQRHEWLAVLLDADWNRAPWIPRDAVERCGALVLLNLSPDADRDPVVDTDLRSLLARANEHGTWHLPWPGGANDGSTRATILWGIIDAAPGATCPL